MRKIVFVTPQFKNGGGNRVFVELANSISRRGDYEIEIVYPNNSLEINHYKIEANININIIGRIGLNLFHKLFNSCLLFCYIIKTLKNKGQTTIIISDPILSVFLWVIPKKFNKDVIRFIQADDYKLFDDLYILKNKFFLFIFKLLTIFNYKLKLKYIFNSSFSYDRFIEVSKRTDVPELIIHPAVDKDIFYNLKAQNNYVNNKISICLIARDHPLKKLEDFIEAWNGMLPDVKNKVSQVFLISTDKLDKFDLSEFVLIRPQSDCEIAEVFRKSNIFISTSLWEGFSLPPLEALNCGMTILSSDSGGVREYAYNDFNASLYTPGSVTELKEKLTELINDKKKRDKYKENATEIIKEFSWDKSAKKLLLIIEN
ncbi:glycosyltransferase family 4 protein [Flavobacterium sp. RSP29]|uniref:glycosyltransferase family 4 protein n=1 Tax=Flavobacterium sp. RSP29 TaxID=3401731 RepID=UPI003AAD4119